MDDIYKTIKDTSQGLYKEKGSKFISFAIPIESQQQAKENLENIKKQYHSARHHCYAWSLGPKRKEYRINDDGEPSGTAGKPIYGQILSFEITNVLIVVIRYFGGVKLGTGGLITAYKLATADALNNNKIVSKTIKEVYRVHFDYALIGDVMRIFKENENNVVQINRKFELDCTIDFEIRQKNVHKIIPLFDNFSNIKIEYLYTK